MELGQEQRLTSRLLKYWELLRKTGKMPEMKQFNRDAVSDLWKQCLLLSIDTHGAPRYKYEYMGEAIAQAHGRDLTGQLVNTASKTFPGAVICKKLADAASGQSPVEDAGHFLSNDGKLIKYRACFLPLGNEQKGVTHVIVGLSFRVF